MPSFDLARFEADLRDVHVAVPELRGAFMALQAAHVRGDSYPTTPDARRAWAMSCRLIAGDIRPAADWDAAALAWLRSPNCGFWPAAGELARKLKGVMPLTDEQAWAHVCAWVGRWPPNPTAATEQQALAELYDPMTPEQKSALRQVRLFNIRQAEGAQMWELRSRFLSLCQLPVPPPDPRPMPRAVDEHGRVIEDRPKVPLLEGERVAPDDFARLRDRLAGRSPEPTERRRRPWMKEVS